LRLLGDVGFGLRLCLVEAAESTRRDGAFQGAFVGVAECRVASCVLILLIDLRLVRVDEIRGVLGVERVAVARERAVD
jgi:hypothetical protein